MLAIVEDEQIKIVNYKTTIKAGTKKIMRPDLHDIDYLNKNNIYKYQESNINEETHKKGELIFNKSKKIVTNKIIKKSKEELSKQAVQKKIIENNWSYSDKEIRIKISVEMLLSGAKYHNFYIESNINDIEQNKLKKNNITTHIEYYFNDIPNILKEKDKNIQIENINDL